MNYKTYFSELWEAVNVMGAKHIEYEPVPFSAPDINIDAELEEGKEVDIGDVGSTGGVLSIHGRQVLLYIPDQGSRIRDVLDNPSQGRKFHVADCRTLQDMRKKGRFERYKVTNSLTGIFDVSGTEFDVAIEGKAELKVCKNCLDHLNYKGYRTCSRLKSKIFAEFSIERFFESYSTFFGHLPRQFINRDSGYPDDWADISAKVRSQANWTCQQCRLQLQSNRHLLHVHHVDGNKRHNQLLYLKLLCADCHRKQPMHESMFIKHSEMADIQRLRREQGIHFDRNSWQDVYKHADLAYEGVLKIFEQRGFSPPEIWYAIEGPGREVILTADLAWPEKKMAVVRDNADIAVLVKLGWKGTTVGELLAEE